MSARPLCLAVLFAFATSPALAQCGMGGMTHIPAIGPQATESGQGAFGAIHEIVGILEADPTTDWSKVNIDALRAHLIDMDNVTLRAKIVYEPMAKGEHIHIAGEGDVRDSIQRMVMMHAAMAGDTSDWHMDATRSPDGADIVVTAKSSQAIQKIKALGLLRMMAESIHHTRHHMMLARGTM
jgi:hypothetical protein